MGSRSSFFSIFLFGTPRPSGIDKQIMLGVLYSRFHAFKIPIGIMSVLTSTLAFGSLALYDLTLWLIVWYALVMIPSGVMIVSGNKTLRFDPVNVRSDRFIGRAERLGLILGLLWSSICFAQFWPGSRPADEVVQVVLIAGAMGMACGAVLFTAPLVGVGVRYLQGTLFVLAVSTLTITSGWVVVMALFGLALTIGLTVSAITLHSSTMKLVEKSQEAGRSSRLLERSLANSRHGFCIVNQAGEMVASNNLFESMYNGEVGAVFVEGVREYEASNGQWYLEDVRSFGDGYLMITITDISKQKEVEERLHELNDKIDEADASRRRVLGAIVKNLSEPARHISVFASAIAPGSNIPFSSEETGDILQRISQQSASLLRAVTDLADVSSHASLHEITQPRDSAPALASVARESLQGDLGVGPEHLLGVDLRRPDSFLRVVLRTS
jgi:hypothetical protein